MPFHPNCWLLLSHSKLLLREATDNSVVAYSSSYRNCQILFKISNEIIPIQTKLMVQVRCAYNNLLDSVSAARFVCNGVHVVRLDHSFFPTG